MLLADFTDPDEASRWRSTDDVVMGGRSSSAMLAGDLVGVLVGRLSLERGGGFASVRRHHQLVDLSGHDAIELRVRGDGRRYKLNLRTGDDFDGVVYQAAFETLAETWQTVRLPLESFAARFRGRPVPGTLDRARVCSLGLLISDRQEGPFRLEVATITAAARPG